MCIAKITCDNLTINSLIRLRKYCVIGNNPLECLSSYSKVFVCGSNVGITLKFPDNSVPSCFILYFFEFHKGMYFK